MSGFAGAFCWSCHEQVSVRRDTRLCPKCNQCVDPSVVKVPDPDPDAPVPANAPPILPAIYSTGAGPFMQVHGDKLGGPYIGERRVADIVIPSQKNIEAALDAEAEGDPRDVAAIAAALEIEGVASATVERTVPRPDYVIEAGNHLLTGRVATKWEEPDPPGRRHYITTICEGAPDDGTGRCPKCHLAIGFDNDYDGSVEGVLQREIEGLRQQAQQEEEAAINSGGILSDVCDIAFNDEGRAMTEGYDGIRERVRELVELERRLIESAEGENDGDEE